MNSYITISEFVAPQIGVRLSVGNTVGKIAPRSSVLIGSTEYISSAFFNWIGTADSLNYLSFVGVLPDPIGPAGAITIGGSVAITSGESVVTVSGAAFGFIPSSVIVTVLKPNPGSGNIFATTRIGTITTDGFICDLSSAVSTAGYSLGYIVIQ